VRTFTDQEIFERCLFPMINEGFKILESSREYSPEEIDYICVSQFGWPKFRGGPMILAERELKLVY
jgi:3-hydroxyacyl-CoA dehydrogenase